MSTPMTDPLARLERQDPSRIVYQPIRVPLGTRVTALRAGVPEEDVPLDWLACEAARAVAGWNRRHPSLAVDLVVDLTGRALHTPQIDEAIRYALAVSGLGGRRLTVSARGFDDDPVNRPVPASRLAALLLPRVLARRPR